MLGLGGEGAGGRGIWGEEGPCIRSALGARESSKPIGRAMCRRAVGTGIQKCEGERYDSSQSRQRVGGGSGARAPRAMPFEQKCPSRGAQPPDQARTFHRNQ